MFKFSTSVTNWNFFGAYPRNTAPKSLSVLATTLSILLLVCDIPQTLAQVSQDHSDWVTTWTTSPSTLPPDEPNDNILDNQTIRLIVHTSIGGEAMRLRLSNTHGDRSLEIGAISVAQQVSGANIVPGSSQSITFSGQGSITIPRWATVISDPVAWEVPQSGNLAVSIYLPGESGFVSTHALSNQTNYVSSDGDHTTATALPIAEETPGWPFLTAIDVIAESPTRAIVTLGDSITDGWGSSDSANQRWPNHFAHRLYRDASIHDFAVVNAGISGNRVTTEANPTFGQNLQARFQRDVLTLANVSHIVLLEGINDIGMSSLSGELVSADQIISGYRQIITRAHARGIKVIGATLLPYEGAAYYTDAGNLVRMEVNDFIRSSGEFDGVIEFDTVVADPANPNRIRPDFTEDNLHPNDAGYRVMADSIDLDLFR
ncbi:MAG: SGNH/GDSL hydrolase family protein [Gammaproteobacteria bacterium]|nr:SGNH/GDSL hydrolase family protein [Gammaproteobacteria bacterium]